MVFSFVMVSLVVCVLFKQGGALNALNQSPLLPLAFPPLFDLQCVYVVIAVWSVCICHTVGVSVCTAAKIFFGQAVLKSADITIAIYEYIRS